MFSTYKCNRTKISAKYRIFVSSPFSQNLFPFLFTPPLPPIPISHQLSRWRMFFFTLSMDALADGGGGGGGGVGGVATPPFLLLHNTQNAA